MTINRDVVKAYIDQFDGDVVAAAKALQSYAREQQTTKHRQVSSYKPKNSEIIVSVRDLHKSYKLGKQQIVALSGATLDIHKGEFIALTGASGSGKSTLLQLIGGLDKPTSGEIVVGDTNINRLSDKKLSQFRNTTIGFVFQFFYLQPFLNVQTNVEIPGMFAGGKRAGRRAKSLELIGKVGLGDRALHKPKELSGGQMQRAAIARALLNQPQILLADEPTGNLDSENSRAIIELFKSIRDEFGTTIVIVTHDHEIARQADREIILKDGAVV